MKQRVFFLISLFLLISPAVRGSNENVSLVGEWGSAYYADIEVKDNYAFCLTTFGDIDIIDISQPTGPVKAGNYNTPGHKWNYFVYGNYLYVVTDDDGLLVLDISDPKAPTPVSTYGKNKNIADVFVSGNYAYCICNYSKTLMILDISDPANLREISSYEPQDYYIYGMYVTGNYAYLNCSRKMEIVDISNPAAPVLTGVYDYELYQGDDFSVNWYGSGVILVDGGCAYIILFHEEYPDSDYIQPGLFIIDIFNPANPSRKGCLEFNHESGISDLRVSGDYAYAAGYANDLYIINVSSPSSPGIAGKYDQESNVYGLFVRDNFAYLTAYENGLLVVNAAEPANPTLVGRFDKSGEGSEAKVRGDYAFMARRGSGLDILDISSPAAPVQVGNFAAYYADSVTLYGDYAYLSGGHNGIWVIDISDPGSPFKTAQIPTYYFPGKLLVSGSYLYAAADPYILIFDITEPSAPTQVTSFENQGWIDDFYINGNYLYIAGFSGLNIMDVSNPLSPIPVGNCDVGEWLRGVVVHGNYAYVTGSDTGLKVIDVRDPGNPGKVGQYNYKEGYSVHCHGLYAEGNYLFLADWYAGLLVFDISTPSDPRLAGRYQSGAYPRSVYKSGEYLYLAEWQSGKLSVLKFTEADKPAQLVLSKSYIRFAGTRATGPHTGSQTVLISNPGEADMHWSITKELPDLTDWVSFTPTSGTNSGKITITVDPAQLWYICDCTYEATLVVSAPEAVIPTKTIKVDLRMWNSNKTLEPFGEFATPLDGSIVSGSIPVTGWTLDDLEVKSVGIYRETNSGPVYIGDGIFIEGARPDVEEAYSWFPLNDRAGWGYMLLTNYLPDGPLTLQAIATDLEGNRVTLGTKTITVDNKNAVKPFGAIDAPAQGEHISGKNYLNFGWALTPQPNTIPFDGSTIMVWVDGIPLGNPVYNQYREDIAAYFPGYNNSEGAVGYFYLDTTAFINGVHSIAWSVTDDAGNSDGIGSRFFTIVNTGIRGKTQKNEDAPYNNKNIPRFTSLSQLAEIPLESTPSLKFVKGYKRDGEPETALADEGGLIRIQICQLERLEIHLNPVRGRLIEDKTGRGDPRERPAIKENGGKTFFGCQVVGGQLKPLPIGSHLDAGTGIFYWQPGVGFVGSYRLVFIHTDRDGNRMRREVEITIVPR